MKDKIKIIGYNYFVGGKGGYMFKNMLIKYRKLLLWCLLISFIGTVICAVFMQVLPKGNISHLFKELHGFFGFTMVIFVCLHLANRWRVFFPFKKDETQDIH